MLSLHTKPNATTFRVRVRVRARVKVKIGVRRTRGRVIGRCFVVTEGHKGVLHVRQRWRRRRYRSCISGLWLECSILTVMVLYS